MGRNPRAARVSHFDTYGKQLEFFKINPAGLFVCPLCRIGYFRQALDMNPPWLTLAHIVPEALGGKQCTLACKKCNSDNGARLESDLQHNLEYAEWSQGRGSWPARISLDGVVGDIGAVIRRKGVLSNWSVVMNPRQSHPQAFTTFNERLRANAGKPDANVQWNMSWSVYERPGEVAAAYYQSAYLLMFAYFGYGFAFNDQYELLRQQIISPRKSIWPGRINVVQSPQLLEQLGNRECGVVFVRAPEPCVAVLLRFRPKSGVEKLVAVLLPRPDSDGLNVPHLEFGSLTGSLIPYRQEKISAGRNYFSWLWRHTQQQQKACAIGSQPA